MAKKKNTGPVFATVIGGSMFVRERPDHNSARVCILDNGATVEVLKVTGAWAQIREGFVLADYLDGLQKEQVPVKEKDGTR